MKSEHFHHNNIYFACRVILIGVSIKVNLRHKDIILNNDECIIYEE